MIFVTGGTGLVGSHLLRLLSEEGNNVRALYRDKIPGDISSLPGVQWVKGDILDITGLEEILDGVQQVYHCAAIVSFQPRDKHDMIRYNVEGTANIVNASILHNVKKLVFVSSVAALAKKVKPGVPIDESDAWTETSGFSAYGKSKFLAEMEVWRGMGEGLETVVVNPTIILGESDWNKSSAALFKTVYHEFPWYSEGTTGWVDVKDVVKAMTMLMQSDINGERFILSNETSSFRQLFIMIAERFGKRPPYRKVTPFLAALIWRLENIRARFTGKAPLVTKETTASAMAKIEYDNRKLPAHLPAFSYTPLKETMDRVCNYFLERYAPAAKQQL